MNGAQLHLLLNHWPIVGTVISIGLLVWAFFSKSKDIKKVALVVTVLMSLMAFPAFWTGEGAEEVIEHQPGIEKNYIEDHESVAKQAMVVNAICGLAAIGLLVILLQKKDVQKSLIAMLILGYAINFGMMARAGHFGGAIHHPEIRKAETINH